MLCEACIHYGVRGGTILPVSPFCSVAETSGFTEQQAEFLGLILVDLATHKGSCPHLRAIPDFPDSYRAEDLPR